MPILVSDPVCMVDQGKFMAIDREVMKHAFAMHNRYGALCDERIYSDELAAKCAAAGLGVSRESQITVTHQNFRKVYFIDLLVESGSIYELKAADGIVPEYEKQLLNYLFLRNALHGKILAFGGASVKHRFVSTRLDHDKRHDWNLDTRAWRPLCGRCEALPAVLSSLLEDWGSCLSANLYREALAAIVGNGRGLTGYVRVVDGSREVGVQKELLLDANIVLSVTGSSRGTNGLRTHLRRLLSCSTAEAIQWINFDRQSITLKTLQK